MSQYAVYFSGEIRPGLSKEEVKQNLAKLFKTDQARIEPLFSGQEVTLKTDLDEVTAEKYKTILEQAGALVRIKSPLTRNPAPTSSATEKGLLNVQPRDVYMAAFQHIEVTDFGIAALGSQLVEPTEQPTVHIDTSKLSLSPVGSDLQDPPREQQAVKTPDISHLKLQAD